MTIHLHAAKVNKIGAKMVQSLTEIYSQEDVREMHPDDAFEMLLEALINLQEKIERLEYAVLSPAHKIAFGQPIYGDNDYDSQGEG